MTTIPRTHKAATTLIVIQVVVIDFFALKSPITLLEASLFLRDLPSSVLQNCTLEAELNGISVDVTDIFKS